MWDFLFLQLPTTSFFPLYLLTIKKKKDVGGFLDNIENKLASMPWPCLPWAARLKWKLFSPVTMWLKAFKACLFPVIAKIIKLQGGLRKLLVCIFISDRELLMRKPARQQEAKGGVPASNLGSLNALLVWRTPSQAWEVQSVDVAFSSKGRKL